MTSTVFSFNTLRVIKKRLATRAKKNLTKIVVFVYEQNY
jgi:hypothetical protein